MFFVIETLLTFAPHIAQFNYTKDVQKRQYKYDKEISSYYSKHRI